eukprot:15457933-Alexandrium_andersonii.AAC.1
MVVHRAVPGGSAAATPASALTPHQTGEGGAQSSQKFRRGGVQGGRAAAPKGAEARSATTEVVIWRVSKQGSNKCQLKTWMAR